MSNNEKITDIAKGAGAAIGFLIVSFFRLGFLWLGLWILAHFGLLPF